MRFEILLNLIQNVYKNILPKTLLARFAAIIIIPTLIAQLLITQIFYYKHWYHVSGYSTGIIVREIDSLIKNIVDRDINQINKNISIQKYDLDKDQKSELCNNCFRVEKYLSLIYELTDLTNLPKFPQNNLVELKIFKNELDNLVKKNSSIRLINEERVIEIYIEVDINQHLIKHHQSNELSTSRNNSQHSTKILRITIPSKTLINPSVTIFIMWFFFLGIFLLLISLIFTKNQIKSIIELTKAAESYGSGQGMSYYKPSGAMEIRKAGLAFLRMKDRIERQNSKRTQMLAMISHDLKTPLTRMKLQVALIEDDEAKEELEHDIHTMENMIASYLDFARGEGGESFQVVDIADWMSRYLKTNWAHVLGTKLLFNELTVESELTSEEKFSSGQDEIISLQENQKDNLASTDNNKNIVYASIKPNSFSRSISNIIENAIKYSSKSMLSISTNEEYIIISLEDDGPSIDKSERSDVFKPFYRCDKSRKLDSGASVGLGLAITKEIINGHYGSVSLKDSEMLGGLKVEITIPRNDNQN